MWNIPTRGSPWLDHQSEPTSAGHPQCEKQVPTINAKSKQRRIKSHKRHHERPSCPRVRWSVTRCHHLHDSSDPKGQPRDPQSGPATVDPQPPQFCFYRCSVAAGNIEAHRLLANAFNPEPVSSFFELQVLQLHRLRAVADFGCTERLKVGVLVVHRCRAL